jgi:hypothetical protein
MAITFDDIVQFILVVENVDPSVVGQIGLANIPPCDILSPCDHMYGEERRHNSVRDSETPPDGPVHHSIAISGRPLYATLT